MNYGTNAWNLGLQKMAWGEKSPGELTPRGQKLREARESLVNAGLLRSTDPHRQVDPGSAAAVQRQQLVDEAVRQHQESQKPKMQSRATPRLQARPAPPTAPAKKTILQRLKGMSRARKIGAGVSLAVPMVLGSIAAGHHLLKKKRK